MLRRLYNPSRGCTRRLNERPAEAAKRRFAPEFMNRIDKVVVFHPMRGQQLEQVLEIELGILQQRVFETSGPFLLRLTPAARRFLLREGTDLKYGARHLKRAIERHLVWPLANLRASEQVSLGDVVWVDWNGADAALSFSRHAESFPVSVTLTHNSELQQYANLSPSFLGRATH